MTNPANPLLRTFSKRFSINPLEIVINPANPLLRTFSKRFSINPLEIIINPANPLLRTFSKRFSINPLEIVINPANPLLRTFSKRFSINPQRNCHKDNIDNIFLYDKPRKSPFENLFETVLKKSIHSHSKMNFIYT